MADNRRTPGLKEWYDLRNNPNGVDIEATENFLKRFPNFQLAEKHLAEEKARSRDSLMRRLKQEEASSRGFASFEALKTAQRDAYILQKERDFKRQHFEREESSAKARGFASVEAMHKAEIRGEGLKEQKHKKYKAMYDDFFNQDNLIEVDPALNNESTNPRKPISIKVAERKPLEPGRKIKGILKRSEVPKGKYYDNRMYAIPYTSHKFLAKAGNNSLKDSVKNFNLPVNKNITNTNNISTYTPAEINRNNTPFVDSNSKSFTPKQYHEEGLSRKFNPSLFTTFTLSTTPRATPRAVYKDRQNSVPFKDYPQHGRIIPNTVVHKSKMEGGNVVLNGGEPLSHTEVIKDVEKQREELSQNKPTSMFSKTTPEEKARLTRLDELTAAYHGLNTNVAGSKGSVQVDRVKGLSTKVGTDDLSKIETTTRSPFPTQLTGINNLEGSDLNAFKAAYNQDLELNRIGKQAGFVDLKDSDIYTKDPLTQEVITKRSIDPWAGSNQRSLTHGYGMGWGNMWRASAKDNAKRAMTVVNPLSRGNISVMLEQLGRVSTRDMLAFKANPTIMNRLGITAAPAFATGFVGYGMYDNQDIGEIVSNLAVPVLALPGARAGLAIGSFLTPAKTATNFGILRGAGMAAGASVGFVTGASVVLAATAGISDITSNESSIRKFASKRSKIEFLVPEVNSRQSLTARQMALNKLSKSGLNDRALLLGNEAAALGGYL